MEGKMKMLLVDDEINKIAVNKNIGAMFKKMEN